MIKIKNDNRLFKYDCEMTNMVFKCKMCSGDIEIIKGTNTGKCLYCKSVMTLPLSDNEKIINLYNRANDLRLDNEFDKAYGIYETILEIDNKQVEAHWGLLLCKYGVEYVDDPKTKKKIPTCHRTIPTSILKDAEYNTIKKEAYGDALELYKKEAETIDKIQKGILEISSKEQPYDIFICYKETDENGDRTRDSVIAQDIYDKLIEKGYKVFFSRITLEDKLGTEYEPYIYSALTSAKVMLVVGTKEEYFNAVWVKNEWSRFIEMMKKDKSKTLIPVFSKIDVYKIPEEFAMYQAQSMDKVGAMQDLIRGINKIVTTSKNANSNDLDEGTAKKVQDVLEGAADLGNNRYEVTVTKEKRAVWYYICILAFAGLYCWMKLFSILGDCFAVFFSTNIREFIFGNIGTKDFSGIISIIQVLACILIIVASILKIKNRSCYKLANYFIYAILFLEFISMYVSTKYLYIISIWYLVTVLIPILILFINPKWQLDTSTKIIVNGEEKNKLLLKNKQIREDFKKKEKLPIKIKIFIGIIVLAIGIYGLFLYNSKFADHSNKKDETKVQVEIVASYVNIRTNPKNYDSHVRGIAKKGEKYTILNTMMYDYEECNLWYEIETNNGITGYICGKPEYIKYLTNQGNKRDKSLKQLEILNDFIRIRKDYTIYSDSVGHVGKGEIYTIIDEKSDYGGGIWYKIKTTYGTEGYIYSGDKNEYVKIYNAEN